MSLWMVELQWEPWDPVDRPLSFLSEVDLFHIFCSFLNFDVIRSSGITYELGPGWSN